MKSKAGYLTLVHLLFLILLGCQKMDDSYKKFIVSGGRTYPGKAVRPVAHSGKNRVLLSWNKGTDPSITKAVIYWNNYTDSLTVDILAGEDSINVYIDPLPEQQYTFQIVTLNARGDRSVPAEVLGTAYGELYQMSLLTRPLIQAFFIQENTVNLNWGVADITGGAIGTELRYTDTSDITRVVYLPIEDAANSITDIKGTSFDYRTIFRPDSMAIDTFYTDYTTFEQVIPEGGTVYLIDFAPEGNTENNQPTESPDANGHYWNNYHGNNANSSLLLLDMENNYGGISLTTVSNFAVNTSALLGPQQTESGLGELSIRTATMDCFYVENNTGTLKFTGLNPSKGYILHVYGARVAGDTRKTKYTVTGAASFTGILQTSGQSGSNANINELYTTPLVYPTIEGEIRLSVTNETSVFGYINALKLEEK